MKALSAMVLNCRIRLCCRAELYGWDVALPMVIPERDEGT
jgi:hypothetical protein